MNLTQISPWIVREMKKMKREDKSKRGREIFDAAGGKDKKGNEERKLRGGKSKGKNVEKGK